MKKAMLVVLLAAIALFAMVGTAHAAASDAGTVTVNASVNKMVVLTLSTASVDFGAMDPGTSATRSVTVYVQSNTPYRVLRSLDGTAALLGFSVTTNSDFDGLHPFNAHGSAAAPGEPQAYPETYKITNLPWTTDSGTYASYVSYTVTAP